MIPHGFPGCLDEDVLLRFLDGGLSKTEQEEAEAHLDTCVACRRLLGAAAQDPDAQSNADLSRGAPVGRYLVLSLLGSGGMGLVYTAYDTELDRRVALKFLHPATDSERARKRLLHEARVLGRLSHPNVVQVHDVGIHDGDVFIALELVDGCSLDIWCKTTPRPGWRDVLAAYLEAARGLAAAHAIGLVHRDVKPANLLRGNDGRVRVADFGLVAGTLLYMAPEQHQGGPSTAASDQYSLCVALYEGLYGTVPFSLAPLAPADALLAQKLAGPPATPPPTAGDPRIPKGLYHALARGMAPDPADRYPSMNALIEAMSLKSHRGALLEARWVLTIGLALLIFALLGWLRGGIPGAKDPCAHPEQQLAGTWDESIRRKVQAAFFGTGRAHAQAITTRVLASLDRYAANWSAMRMEVCQSSQSGRQRSVVTELRDSCLDRRRDQMQALTTLLAERPDVEILDRAPRAVADLAPLSPCADTEALTARVRPPEDPVLRAKVAELERRVDRLGALRVAGKYHVGLVSGKALLSEAESLSYPALLAQVRFRMGLLHEGTGDYEEAKLLLRAAAASAGAAKDDLLVANSWAWLLFITAERQKRLAEATLIEALGPTVIARVQDEQTMSNWLNSVGLLQTHTNRFSDARATFERALHKKQQALGSEHPDTIATLNNLANVHHSMGNYEEARRVYERILLIAGKVLGPDHPDLAHVLYNLGSTLDLMGKWHQAKASLERALVIRQASLPPEHPSIAAALTNLASVRGHLGDHQGAKEAYQRALTIREKSFGLGHVAIAYTQAGLCRIEVRLGQPTAARGLCERALTTLQKERGAKDGSLVEPLLGIGEAWLAQGRPTQALPVLERAAALESEADYRCEVHLALAEALYRMGHKARAKSLAEQAHQGYKRLGHEPGITKATHWITEHPL